MIGSLISTFDHTLNAAAMVVFVLPLLAALASASPIQQNEMLTKQALKAIPTGWEFKSAAPADMKINMHIALKEQNMDKLQQRLMETSDPSHRDYGKHMSKDEIESMTAPSQASVESVKQWLASHGVQSGEVANGFLPITVTTSQAEKMLGTKYGVYYNADRKRYTVRTMEYSLPKDLHEHVDMVQPTTMFSDMNMFNDRVAKTTASFTKKPSKARQNGSACSFSSVTPACLQEIYSMNYTPTSNTAIGITGYLGEIASEDDLQQFLQQFATNVPSDAAFSVQLVNGGSNDGAGTGEADLDTQ